MKFSDICIIIPAYNPERSLCELVCALHKMTDGASQIIVVDDGSKEASQSYLDEVAAYSSVTIVRHAVNMGKGAALKTAFNYVLLNAKCIGVVTADADGQHLPEDILKVGEELLTRKTSLVLGSRAFDTDIPFRSQIGNKITRFMTRFLLGLNISDTQTGLRGIPIIALPTFIHISADRYDFEMEMLIKASQENISISECKISTVYINKNSSSHFDPIIDSLSIFYVFIRHLGNSLATAAIDYIAFTISFIAGGSLPISIICGRFFSALFNFTVSRYVVFKSKGSIKREIFSYILVLISATCAAYFTIKTLHSLGVPILLAKIIAETIVFFAVFSMLRIFVFLSNTSTEECTDWENYYTRRTTHTPTRFITQRILTSLLKQHAPPHTQRIIEIGGGDSCFFKGIKKEYPTSHYIVIDKSPAGVSLFLKQYGSPKTTAMEVDILKGPLLQEPAEIVFSVGLIEHFCPEDTKRCIKAHFDLVAPGGVVLLTYPTPTLLYRAIRFTAEALGLWRFHDERPLLSSEILPLVTQHGQVLAKKKNWWIGLTQEIIIVKAHTRLEK